MSIGMKVGMCIAVGLPWIDVDDGDRQMHAENAIRAITASRTYALLHVDTHIYTHACTAELAKPPAEMVGMSYVSPEARLTW